MIRNYHPNKVPTTLANINRIRTLNSIEKTWSYLDRYRSPRYGELKLSSEFVDHVTLIPQKCVQIADTIVQAKSYFKSANTAPLEISPLLFFYGMESLAKCLILSGDNEYTLDYTNPANRHHRHHGLSNVGTAQIHDGSSLFEESCAVRTTARQIGVYNMLRSCYSNTPLPHGYQIDIKSLLSLIPETKPDYYNFFNDAPLYWHCDSHFGSRRLGGSDQSIVFRDYDYAFHREENESYRDTILRRFPEVQTEYERLQDGDDSFRTLQDGNNIDDYIYISQLMTNEQYALLKKDGFVFSDIDTHYLLMFILSNLVRYNQPKWSNLISRRENSQIFMIENFINVASQKFPLLILRELDNYMYDFIGPVGTLG